MAVPKTKVSKARKRTRNSANFKAAAPAAAFFPLRVIPNSIPDLSGNIPLRKFS